MESICRARVKSRHIQEHEWYIVQRFCSSRPLATNPDRKVDSLCAFLLCFVALITKAVCVCVCVCACVCVCCGEC